MSIAKKLAGYRQQDRKFDIYSERHFVKAGAVEQQLADADMKCCYCAQVMLTSYPARDSRQWTLDRIDNSMGHNTGNVVVCCLGCNLQRRNRPMAKFLFTKQLRLVKMPGAPEVVGPATDAPAAALAFAR